MILTDLPADEDGLLPSLQEVAAGQGLLAGRDGGEAPAHRPAPGQAAAAAAAAANSVHRHLEETQGKGFLSDLKEKLKNDNLV